MLQQYDFTVAANQTIRKPAPGTYLRYYKGWAGGADPSILVKNDTSGVQAILKPGQAIRLADGEKPAVEWMISNFANAATITGYLAIGDGQLDDSTVTGEVSIVDGGKSRTLAGTAYSGYLGCAAVAAQYPHVQLRNPAGSGKNVFVESFLVSTSVAALITAGTYATQLANAITAATAKKYGGPAAAALSFYENNAVYIPGSILLGQQLGATQSLTINFREPVQLPPGSGFVIGAQTQNSALTASVEFFEEPV